MNKAFLYITVFILISPLNLLAEKAIFAGGCFWCMEPPFEELDGVSKVVSGYTGGEEKDPSYRDVSHGRTGHTEAVEITYDPKKITYKRLVDVFWKNIDPTDAKGQFCDKGSQYRSGIFYLDEEQKKIANSSIKDLKKYHYLKNKKIVTEITKASIFYPAEDYHQDYYKKNSFSYKSYRFGCGRDRKLKQIWNHDNK